MSSIQNALKIGKVSKLTGLTQDRLRVWEKRYEAIEPMRSETGRRLNTFEDVERLKLLKNLIDNGDSISRIAKLSVNELQKRSEISTAVQHQTISNDMRNIILIGNTIDQKLNIKELNQAGFDVTDRFKSLQTLISNPTVPKTDILIIETDTLPPELVDLLNKSCKKPAPCIPSYHTDLAQMMSLIKLTHLLARSLRLH